MSFHVPGTQIFGGDILQPVTTRNAGAGRARHGLTKETGLPFYKQIQHLIRHRIANGEYQPGTQIPSENEMCRQLNVSRITLREALRELVREHLLVKVQGKGTFVALNPPKRLSAVKYTGFMEDLIARVRRMTITAVDVTRIPVTPELKGILELPVADTEVVLVKRIRHVDNEPFSFTLNYLPAHIGSRIRSKDLYALPLNQILQEDLKIPIVRARETVDAAPADPEVAQKLGIPLLFPVMHMKRVMYTTNDRPLELVETYYRADKYHYTVQLIRVKRHGKWTWTTEVETSA
jgi:GntR family transcriptional regulator